MTYANLIKRILQLFKGTETIVIDTRTTQLKYNHVDKHISVQRFIEKHNITAPSSFIYSLTQQASWLCRKRGITIYKAKSDFSDCVVNLYRESILVEVIVCSVQRNKCPEHVLLNIGHSKGTTVFTNTSNFIVMYDVELAAPPTVIITDTNNKLLASKTKHIVGEIHIELCSKYNTTGTLTWNIGDKNV